MYQSLLSTTFSNTNQQALTWSSTVVEAEDEKVFSLFHVLCLKPRNQVRWYDLVPCVAGLTFILSLLDKAIGKAYKWHLHNFRQKDHHHLLLTDPVNSPNVRRVPVIRACNLEKVSANERFWAERFWPPGSDGSSGAGRCDSNVCVLVSWVRVRNWCNLWMIWDRNLDLQILLIRQMWKQCL